MGKEVTSNHRYIATCNMDANERCTAVMIEAIRKDNMTPLGEVKEYPATDGIIRLSIYAR